MLHSLFLREGPDLELLEEIEKVARESAEKLGLSLYKAYFENQKDGKHLFLIVDKKGGMDLNAIEAFTNEVSPRLDEVPGLDFPYLLECLSRGAEHEIEKDEMAGYVGEYMEVSYDGKKVLGTLEKFENDTLFMKYFLKGRPKKAEIPLEKVTRAELRVKF